MDASYASSYRGAPEFRSERSLGACASSSKVFSSSGAAGRPLVTLPGQEGREDAGSNTSQNVLQLHFLGLAGLPVPSWMERQPEYELIVHAGGNAKRLRPRVPAPPPGSAAGDGVPQNFLELVPAEWQSNLLRLDERMSIRMQEPAEFFQVEIWEERPGFLDFANKSPPKRLVGQCYVPLQEQFNRRPCSWAIASRGDSASGTFHVEAVDVGCLTCKFNLVSSPGPVRGLRIREEMVTSSEVRLAWEPPINTGGTQLRGYRVEAAELDPMGMWSHNGDAGAPHGSEARTASTPASATPSATLRGLRGNTAYKFKVWAVSEVGPGPIAEILGHTSALPPGLCGAPQPVDPSLLGDFGGDDRSLDDAIAIEWDPPVDNGGAQVVAYRIWLRPLFLNSFGDVVPADGWIDLGLYQHKGDANARQCAPVRLESFPGCYGCLCSLAAINSAGHTGQATLEVPVFISAPPEPDYDIHELPSPVGLVEESMWGASNGHITNGCGFGPCGSRTLEEVGPQRMHAAPPLFDRYGCASSYVGSVLASPASSGRGCLGQTVPHPHASAVRHTAPRPCGLPQSYDRAPAVGCSGARAAGYDYGTAPAAASERCRGAPLTRVIPLSTPPSAAPMATTSPAWGLGARGSLSAGAPGPRRRPAASVAGGANGLAQRDAAAA